MSNWKIGQKLVCIDESWMWDDLAPKLNDAVTFDGNHAYIPAGIYLKEFTALAPSNFKRVCFHSDSFRPLLGDSAKSELISSFVEVTETSDCPVPEIETA